MGYILKSASVWRKLLFDSVFEELKDGSYFSVFLDHPHVFKMLPRRIFEPVFVTLSVGKA